MPAESSPSPQSHATGFRERLYVPLGWWLLVLFFVVSLIIAIGFYLGPWLGLLAGGVCLAIAMVVLLPFGSLTTTVDDRALTVGLNRVEWEWVAGAKALDTESARRRLGPQADARAHLVTRPYVPEAVEVTLADAADPHPYWFVGSRHADELAVAINARVPKANRQQAPEAESRTHDA